MTTTTLSGFSVQWEQDQNTFDINAVGFDSNAEFTFVYEDDFTFDYFYENDVSSEDPFEIGLNTDPLLQNVYINGQSLVDIDVDADILTVAWDDNGTAKSGTVLILEWEDGPTTDIMHVTLLDGELPELQNLSDWNDFDSNIDDEDVTRATGDFGPGQPIDVADFASFEETTEDDEIEGTEFDDVLNGGIGDDYFLSSTGNDTMDGGEGYDQVTYERADSAVVVNLASGVGKDSDGNKDELISIEMVRGSAYDDKLVGDEFRNQFRGLEGNDTIKGGDGFDVVRYDRDNRYGGTDGVDVDLERGIATDGFGDRDKLISIEEARGTDYNDELDGSVSDNVLIGYDGDDSIRGNDGDDALYGDDGNDTLKGQDGNDTLEGGKGDDTLNGGKDDDRLKGGSGRDTMDGGKGDDKMTGNGSADVFVFKNGFGNDVITDFDANNNSEDIDLSAVSAIVGMQDLRNNHMTQVGDDVVITDNKGNFLTLENVDMGDLSSNDFIF